MIDPFLFYTGISIAHVRSACRIRNSGEEMRSQAGRPGRRRSRQNKEPDLEGHGSYAGSEGEGRKEYIEAEQRFYRALSEKRREGRGRHLSYSRRQASLWINAAGFKKMVSCPVPCGFRSFCMGTARDTVNAYGRPECRKER